MKQYISEKLKFCYINYSLYIKNNFIKMLKIKIQNF